LIRKKGIQMKKVQKVLDKKIQASKRAYVKPVSLVVGKAVSLLRGSGSNKGDMPGRPGAIIG